MPRTLVAPSRTPAIRPFDVKIAYRLADGRDRKCTRKVMASSWPLAVTVALRDIVAEVPIPADAVIKSIKF